MSATELAIISGAGMVTPTFRTRGREPRFLRLDFDNGTPCDLLENVNRSTVIDVYCGSRNRLVGIWEESTCRYHAKVEISMLCIFSDFVPYKENVTTVEFFSYGADTTEDVVSVVVDSLATPTAVTEDNASIETRESSPHAEAMVEVEVEVEVDAVIEAEAEVVESDDDVAPAHSHVDAHPHFDHTARDTLAAQTQQQHEHERRQGRRQEHELSRFSSEVEIDYYEDPPDPFHLSEHHDLDLGTGTGIDMHSEKETTTRTSSHKADLFPHSSEEAEDDHRMYMDEDLVTLRTLYPDFDVVKLVMELELEAVRAGITDLTVKDMRDLIEEEIAYQDEEREALRKLHPQAQGGGGDDQHQRAAGRMLAPLDKAHQHHQHQQKQQQQTTDVRGESQRSNTPEGAANGAHVEDSATIDRKEGVNLSDDEPFDASDLTTLRELFPQYDVVGLVMQLEELAAQLDQPLNMSRRAMVQLLEVAIAEAVARGDIASDAEIEVRLAVGREYSEDDAGDKGDAPERSANTAQTVGDTVGRERDDDDDDQKDNKEAVGV